MGPVLHFFTNVSLLGVCLDVVVELCLDYIWLCCPYVIQMSMAHNYTALFNFQKNQAFPAPNKE